MNTFKKYNLIFGWLSFAIAAIVYVLTLEPTASLWDCGEFIATSYKLEVGHPPGAPLFMMITRFFQIFSPSPQHATWMANLMSGMASAFTILFLFWTITLLALKWFGKKAEELTQGQIWAVMGAGLIGSLAYAFTDTFWFSAVEGEVYGLSSFFTAIVFWAMLRWEQVADEPHANRWLVLIAYLMGLSIGVHLLNLLAFPAMVFIYYFKKYPTITRKGILGAFGVSVAVVVFVLYVICPWTIQLGAWMDLLFVNGFGLPVNSGMAVYALLLFAALGWSVWYTHKKGKVALNTFMLMVLVVILGYSSYASVIIRASANPPMNSNDPSNPFGLMRLLNREQYGDRPLVYGRTYDAPLIAIEDNKSYYVGDDGKYKPVTTSPKGEYPDEFKMLFPRLHSEKESHVQSYNDWINGGLKGRQVPYGGQVFTVPTFGENLEYFFKYQVNFMYWRYFMWNFVGRQNDEQGSGSLLEGNWLSGIDFIDELYLGPQKDLPEAMANNKARNRYYFLPFILGILGILTQLKRDGRGFTVVMWLFFMTGIAIILYLNQTPGEPRERDYAYAGSFYAFSIWIGLGVLFVYDALSKVLKKQRLSAAVATVLCLSVPVILCAENWNDHTRARRYVARDIGYNYLETCLPNAIIMNYGDNDTFPLWYNQEVENVRPDVRIMNASYLSGEWYIDQMKIKSNDSDPVPFTIQRERYYGVNEMVPVQSIFDKATAKQVVEWIKSDHPSTKATTSQGKKSCFIPTQTIQVPVNKENAIASGIVRPEDADLMVDTIEITIKQEYISRVDMMLLDLLAHFDWKRPLYVTAPTILEAFGLQDYLQQDGYAYRFVPIKTPYSYGIGGRIDTEYLYNNLMNKFRYGNVKDPRVNCDYFIRYTMGATQTRNTFCRLANQLAMQGDTTRAYEVLDRMMEEIPLSQIPHNFLWSPRMIETYYRVGKTAQANAMLEDYVGQLKEEFTYLIQFPERKIEHVYFRLQEDVVFGFSPLMKIAQGYGQTDIANDIESFLTAMGVGRREE